MNTALIGLAKQIGAPLITNILERKLSTKSADLVSGLLGEIAGRLGVLPSEVEDVAARAPDDVARVLPEIESQTAARVAIYAAEIEMQLEILKNEQSEPIWMRAWRPGGMYLIGFLWLWNVVILHVCNAIWKIALPPADSGMLMQGTAFYFSLYMGGHTVKDVVSKWVKK